jgi:deltex-like protein
MQKDLPGSNCQEKDLALERALKFMDAIQSKHRELLCYDPDNSDFNGNNFTLMIDDKTHLVQRFVALQDLFRQQKKCDHVDIGYHYTKASYMDHIRTHGLMGLEERLMSNILTESNGAIFGEGIYTAENPYSYHKFGNGEQGLFVARLKGDTGVDCVFGRTGNTDQVCVLKTSSQCLPLASFHADMIELMNDSSMGNNMVFLYHQYLQKLVDDCLNSSPTSVALLLPSQVKERRYAVSMNGSLHASQTTTQPQTTHSTYQTISISYTCPEKLSESQDMFVSESCEATADLCSICFESLNDGNPVVSLFKCKHVFHRFCIDQCLKFSTRCPGCRILIGKTPQGTSPSGTMKIEHWPSWHLTNAVDDGTWSITYTIFSGIQKEYHENPGIYHEGTQRSAYLPDNPEGRKLLKRLRFAFSKGLTFTCGTSLTTKRPNSVVWGSIHHKTSLLGGTYGFPDPGYFLNVNEELDSLGVPKAEEL